jgi:hypothetical protein
VTEQLELEARVATLEARLDAVMHAAKNAPASFGGARFQEAVGAALERQETPPVDALGLGIHPDAKYVSLESWKAKNSVAMREAPTLRAFEPAVLHRPDRYVRSSTSWPEVRQRRAELGLA